MNLGKHCCFWGRNENDFYILIQFLYLEFSIKELISRKTIIYDEWTVFVAINKVRDLFDLDYFTVWDVGYDFAALMLASLVSTI